MIKHKYCYSIEASGTTLEEAEAKLLAQVTAGYVITNKQIKCDGTGVMTQTSPTIEEARQALSEFLNRVNARDVEFKVLSEPSFETIPIEAFDDQEAKAKAETAKKRNVKVKEIKLIRPSKEGFLGFAAKPGEYAVTCVTEAILEARYKKDAEIMATIHNDAVKRELIGMFVATFSDSKFCHVITNMRSIVSDPGGRSELILKRLHDRERVLVADVYKYWDQTCVGQLMLLQPGVGRCGCKPKFSFSWYDDRFPCSFYDGCPVCKKIYVTVD
jgi:hypothetical protein